MENSKQPISPVLTQSLSLQNETRLGLTKREYFAGLAMQGLLSSFTEKASYGGWGSEIEETIKVSIALSDELLKQLEKTN